MLSWDDSSFKILTDMFPFIRRLFFIWFWNLFVWFRLFFNNFLGLRTVIIFFFSWVIFDFSWYDFLLWFYSCLVFDNFSKSTIVIDCLLIGWIIKFRNYFTSTVKFVTDLTNALILRMTERSILLFSNAFTVFTIFTDALIANRTLVVVWKFNENAVLTLTNETFSAVFVGIAPNTLVGSGTT